MLPQSLHLAPALSSLKLASLAEKCSVDASALLPVRTQKRAAHLELVLDQWVQQCHLVRELWENKSPLLRLGNPFVSLSFPSLSLSLYLIF